MNELLNYLKELEIALHQHDLRTDPEKLRQFLHPEFIEIGYSGKTYDFKSIISSLLAEPPSDFIIWSQDYECSLYAQAVAQIRYLSGRLDKDGKLTRHAKRTSIWVKESENWQMKFHQATPTNSFERTNA